MKLNTSVSFLREFEFDVMRLRGLNAPQNEINRTQPTERQPSTAILSIIDGLILIIFFIERTLRKQHETYKSG